MACERMTPPPTVAVAGGRSQLGRSRLINSYALVAFDVAISARVTRSGAARVVADAPPPDAQAARETAAEKRAKLCCRRRTGPPAFSGTQGLGFIAKAARRIRRTALLALKLLSLVAPNATLAPGTPRHLAQHERFQGSRWIEC